MRTDRPILFNAPMVRALLDGSKTQTRRVMKPQPDFESAREILGGDTSTATIAYDHIFGGIGLKRNAGTAFCQPNIHCPYGQPGDRLWVRETWGVVSNAWGADGNLVDWTPDRPATAITEMRFGQGYYSGHAIYAADGSYEWAGDDDGGGEPRSAWHPSIHMPRAASRILLEIVAVRVERLQDISEDDCWAEGIDAVDGALDDLAILDLAKRMNRNCHDAAPTYAALWESINGASSWDANPWVWVVEFKRVTP